MTRANPGKLQRGHAIAGVCLIRLERIEPAALAIAPASRARTRRTGSRSRGTGTVSCARGVYIERRDSDSLLNQLAGGRSLPGKHGAARFEIDGDRRAIRFRMRGEEGFSIEIDATVAHRLPSCGLRREAQLDLATD